MSGSFKVVLLRLDSGPAASTGKSDVSSESERVDTGCRVVGLHLYSVRNLLYHGFLTSDEKAFSCSENGTRTLA
jgi:hypothetical protein